MMKYVSLAGRVWLFLNWMQRVWDDTKAAHERTKKKMWDRFDDQD